MKVDKPSSALKKWRKGTWPEKRVWGGEYENSSPAFFFWVWETTFHFRGLPKVLYLDVPWRWKLVRINGDWINGLFPCFTDPYKWGIPWGEKTHWSWPFCVFLFIFGFSPQPGQNIHHSNSKTKTTKITTRMWIFLLHLWKEFSPLLLGLGSFSFFQWDVWPVEVSDQWLRISGLVITSRWCINIGVKWPGY